MKLRRVLAIAIAVMTMVTMSFTTTVFGDEPQADPQDNAVVAADEEVEATEAEATEGGQTVAEPSSEAVEATEAVELPAEGVISGEGSFFRKAGKLKGVMNRDVDLKALKSAVPGGYIILMCYGKHSVAGLISGLDENVYGSIKIYRSLKKTKKYKLVKTISSASEYWNYDDDEVYFYDTKVKAGKKYYYKVNAYMADGSGYDTINYDTMCTFNSTFDGLVPKYPFKVTNNVGTMGASESYGTYTDTLTVKSIRCSYSKGRLVAKVKFHNEFKKKLKKLTKFHLVIYDDEGYVLGDQTFKNKKLNLKKKKFKTVTFKFSKSKTYYAGTNLRYYLGGYEYEYYVTY